MGISIHVQQDTTGLKNEVLQVADVIEAVNFHNSASVIQKIQVLHLRHRTKRNYYRFSNCTWKEELLQGN